MVSAFAVLSMVVGNLLALLRQNSNASSLFVHRPYGIPADCAARGEFGCAWIGVETALVYLAAYFTMTLGAFAVVTVLSRAEAGRDADSMADYEGLFWRRPLLAVSLAVMLLSLAGIPLTLGFIAKFYLFSAGVEGERWVLLWALIVGSGIGLFYYLRIIFAMTRQHDESVDEIAPRGSFADRSAIVALTLVLLAYGIYPMPLIEFARTAMASFGAATAAARVATDMLGGAL